MQHPFSLTNSTWLSSGFFFRGGTKDNRPLFLNNRLLFLFFLLFLKNFGGMFHGRAKKITKHLWKFVEK